MSFDTVYKTIHKFRFFIFLFWLGAVIGGSFVFSKFLANTSVLYNAPPGSRSEIAQNVLEQQFPKISHEGSLIILIESRHNVSVLTPYIHQFTLQFNHTVYTYPGSVKITNVLGYFLVNGTALSGMGSQFVNADETASIIVVNALFTGNTENNQFVAFIRKTTEDLFTEPEEYIVGVTGTAALWVTCE